ncbi:hypothetical protein LAZ67_18001907 [Cordylochernes scorpioides]|uniref:CCHC-type domain-containing protein n=1 Tax=Cordylochernes scorpioides TaxID=51811 RepID=A0ABY6LGC1_9ARAC|nr:hypothetical protein LAZ67_18001907 [Cordylochernes scorpioides]
MVIFEPKSAHLREVLLFAFNWKKSATEAHRMLEEVHGDHALSKSQLPSPGSVERAKLPEEKLNVSNDVVTHVMEGGPTVRQVRGCPVVWNETIWTAGPQYQEVLGMRIHSSYILDRFSEFSGIECPVHSATLDVFFLGYPGRIFPCLVHSATLDVFFPAPNMEYKRCSSCIPGLGALTGYYQPGQLSPGGHGGQRGRLGSGDNRGCYNCGEEGHRKFECTKPARGGGRGRGQSRDGGSNNTCYNCGEVGHRKYECTNNTAEDGGQEENQRKSKKACYTYEEESSDNEEEETPQKKKQAEDSEEEEVEAEEPPKKKSKKPKSKKKEEDCYLTLQAYRTMPLESARSREMRRPPLRHQPGSQGDARMTRSKRPRRIALHQRPHLQEMEGCRGTTKTRIQRRASLQCQPCIQDGRAYKNVLWSVVREFVLVDVAMVTSLVLVGEGVREEKFSSSVVVATMIRVRASVVDAGQGSSVIPVSKRTNLREQCMSWLSFLCGGSLEMVFSWIIDGGLVRRIKRVCHCPSATFQSSLFTVTVAARGSRHRTSSYRAVPIAVVGYRIEQCMSWLSFLCGGSLEMVFSWIIDGGLVRRIKRVCHCPERTVHVLVECPQWWKPGDGLLVSNGWWWCLVHRKGRGTIAPLVSHISEFPVHGYRSGSGLTTLYLVLQGNPNSCLKGRTVIAPLVSHISEFPVHGYRSGSRHRTTGQSLTCTASPARHAEEGLDFWAGRSSSSLFMVTVAAHDTVLHPTGQSLTCAASPTCHAEEDLWADCQDSIRSRVDLME